MDCENNLIWDNERHEYFIVGSDRIVAKFGNNGVRFKISKNSRIHDDILMFTGEKCVREMEACQGNVLPRSQTTKILFIKNDSPFDEKDSDDIVSDSDSKLLVSKRRRLKKRNSIVIP